MLCMKQNKTKDYLILLVCYMQRGNAIGREQIFDNLANNILNYIGEQDDLDAVVFVNEANANMEEKSENWQLIDKFKKFLDEHSIDGFARSTETLYKNDFGKNIFAAVINSAAFKKEMTSFMAENPNVSVDPNTFFGNFLAKTEFEICGLNEGDKAKNAAAQIVKHCNTDLSMLDDLVFPQENPFIKYKKQEENKDGSNPIQ